MWLTRSILAMVATTVVLSGVHAQQIPAWTQTALNSVARVSAKPCDIEFVCPLSTGSGFVWHPDGFPEPIIVTALHVVAGASTVTIQFTNAESDASQLTAELIAVDRDSDIALLQVVSDWDPAAHPPLRLADGADAQPEVYVFGYRDGLSGTYVEEARRNIEAPEFLGDYLRDERTRAAIQEVGYPSLDTQVAAIGQALRPGDSGAPVLDSNGMVVGMAQGGIPRIGSWIIPTDVFRSATFETEGINDLRALNIVSAYKAQAIYGSHEVVPVDGPASVYFEIMIPAAGPLLQSYGDRLTEDRHQLDGEPFGRYGGNLIGTESILFPGGGDQPDHCTDQPDSWDCPGTYKEEERFVDSWIDATLAIDCFRVDTYLSFVDGSVSSVWSSNVGISIPIGDLRRNIREGVLKLEVDPYDPSLVLSSNGFIDVDEGVNGNRHSISDIESLSEMYGGACRLVVEVASMEDSGQDGSEDQLSELVEKGSICAYFKVGEARMPLSLIGRLSFSGSLEDAEFWGLLPLGEVNVPFEDFNCF